MIKAQTLIFNVAGLCLTQRTLVTKIQQGSVCQPRDCGQYTIHDYMTVLNSTYIKRYNNSLGNDYFGFASEIQFQCHKGFTTDETGLVTTPEKLINVNSDRPKYS